MGVNQSDRQASVRAVTGTAWTYEGDWHALFDQAGIASGDYNGRLLAWINQSMGASYAELNGAMSAFAASQSAPSWNEMGTFTPGSAPVAAWDASTSTLAQLAVLATHTRTSLATMFDSTGKLTYAPNNLLTQSNTFSNAAWTKTNVTLAAGQTDPLGGSNATRVTATGANGQLYQAISSQPTLLSTLWVRRISGSGNVNLFTPAGGTGALLSLTGSWQQFTQPPGTGNIAGIIVSTSGDAIDVYAATASAVTYETSPRTADQVITTSAAYYGPRIDYDPNTLAVKGLLIEEARTNYCPYSSALSSWAVGNGTVTNNSGATLDPSGLNTATLVNPTGGSNTSLAPPAFTASGSTQYTASYFVKSAGAGFVQIAFYDSTNALLYTAGFDLSTGANTSASAGVTALTSVNIGNGWWRLSATWTSAVSTAAIIPVVYPKSSGAGANPTASDKIYVWGPQYEKGTATSSYVANSSTGTTARAADVVQFTGAALTALQGSAFSAIGEAQTIAAPAVQAVLFGANSSVAFVYAPGTNNQAALYDGTSIAAAATAGGGRTWSGLARSGIGVSGSTASEVMTGGTVATGSHALPARTTAYLGTYSGGAYLNGWVKSFAIYNQRLSDATLQAKSVVGASY